MNGALVGLWLAFAVGACGFNGETGVDAPPGDGSGIDAPPDSDPGDDAVVHDAPLDGLPMICTPGAATCTGRELSTCNADGTAIVTTACDLACNAGACYRASNLASDVQRQCTAAAPTIALTNGMTAFIDRASVPTLQAGAETITATVVSSTGVEPSLAVFCLGGLDIQTGARLVEEGIGDSTAAIVLLVAGDVNIAGQVVIDGRGAEELVGGRGGMGGSAGGNVMPTASGSDGLGPCGGLGGGRRTSLTEAAAGGGGGAGNGGVGGEGGSGRGGGVAGIPLVISPGGDGGMACTTEALVPLVGGSGGGAGADGNCAAACSRAGGGGGGALQISASGTISITGFISAAGGTGREVSSNTDVESSAGGGGGAGGSILIEGPAITVGANALRVPGGNGGASQSGSGGGGGATQMNGTGGASSPPTARKGGAGGGGAAGRVRLNSLAAPSCGQIASPAAACTAGALASQP